MKIHIYLTGNGGCIEKTISSEEAIDDYIRKIMTEGFYEHLEKTHTYYPPSRIAKIIW